MAKPKNYKHELKKVSGLIPYVQNSRTHSDEQINQVASSIKEFGFTNPILVDEQGGIIAGHGRAMAANKLGIDEVPCIILEGLTKAQKKAYVIADNQLALNAEWDIDTLKLEIEGLKELDFDVDLLGFDDSFLDVISFDEDFDAGTEGDQGQLDNLDPKYVDCPHCKKTFDLRDIE
jgi:ParB-like chromosome segregation protein Spo0J